MKVKYICRECGKTPCEITLDNGDTPTHCIVAASKCPWQRAETQPAQEPKPELMTGLQARCKVFAQGGGEIWFEAEGKTPEHRVTIGADCVVTKGTANGLTETQKVYTVRPLPLATVAT